MNKTVIVADDFMSTRKVIGTALESLGLTILMAENGEEAKYYLDGRKIDLIITDLNMPVMNGMELTKTVRESGKYCRLPILLLTTEINKEKIQTAFDAGITALISKPYDSSEFITKVKRLLGL